MTQSVSTVAGPASTGVTAASACHPPSGDERDQQKDNLCAPFVGARIIRRAGITQYKGDPVDQDLVAQRSGTTLPDVEGNWVPPAAQARRDYTRPLARSRPEEAGTAPGALAQAIEEISGGLLEVVPVTGDFDGTRVEHLVAGAHTIGASLIANLRTGLLWGSRPEPEAVCAELLGVTQEGPPPDWDVGHFLELQLLIRGPTGSMVVVEDSYPTLGWHGRHLQPPRVVARALMRGDGRAGGVLVVVPRGSAPPAVKLADELGLENRTWDNGSRVVSALTTPETRGARRDDSHPAT